MSLMQQLRFKIQNLVVRKLYVERLFEMFLPIDTERSEARQIAKHFYQTGDLQAACDFMEQRYFRVFDNRNPPYNTTQNKFKGEKNMLELFSFPNSVWECRDAPRS